MTALATDLPVRMNTKENSRAAIRAGLSLSDQLSALYRVLRVLAIWVRSLSHHSSPPSDSSSESSSSVTSSSGGLGSGGA